VNLVRRIYRKVSSILLGPKPQTVDPERLPASLEFRYKTLREEIHKVCFEIHQYPRHWPRHECCPCCGSSKIKYAFAKYQIDHWKCRQCAFFFVNPYPPQEVLRELYDGAYYTGVRKYIEEPKVRKGAMDASLTVGLDYLKPVAEEVFRLKPAGTWLDVGGGIGGFANAIRTWNPNYQVFLNELNADSCRFARDFYKINVLGCSLPQLREQGLSFDVISMVGVLEHISHPRAVLEQMGQLLKPDGMLALTVPRFSPLNALISRGASPCVVPPFHLSLFNCRNLMMCLKSSGLYKKLKAWTSGHRAFNMMQFLQYGDKWDLIVPTREQDAVTNIKLTTWTADDEKQGRRLEEMDEFLAPWIETIDGKGLINIVLRKSRLTKRRGRDQWSRPTSASAAELMQ
jgi:2-polyprenyl-3-methyl-5-hydroxy-6-metoxy-1,4-benzoquinol methylase